VMLRVEKMDIVMNVVKAIRAACCLDRIIRVVIGRLRPTSVTQATRGASTSTTATCTTTVRRSSTTLAARGADRDLVIWVFGVRGLAPDQIFLISFDNPKRRSRRRPCEGGQATKRPHPNGSLVRSRPTVRPPSPGGRLDARGRSRRASAIRPFPLRCK